MTPNVDSFDHVHLTEVDPNFAVLDEGNYTLKVLKAALKSFTYKQGAKAGQEGQRVSFSFIVEDDPNYSGRRVFENMFPGDFTLKALRRLMDATGVTQAPGQPIAEWLTVLEGEQPRFRIFISKVEDRDREGNPRSFDFKGDCAMINRLNWREVLPA